MTDLTLKFSFTDRGGNKVYDVIAPEEFNLQWDKELEQHNLGQIRISDKKSVVMMEDDQPVSTKEAAQFLKKSPITLKRWRSQGRGPTFRKTETGRIEYTLLWLREYSEGGKKNENLVGQNKRLIEQNMRLLDKMEKLQIKLEQGTGR
jgi:hypothetical protein